jgi:hypothetical protein
MATPVRLVRQWLPDVEACSYCLVKSSNRPGGCVYVQGLKISTWLIQDVLIVHVLLLKVFSPKKWLT